VPPDRKAVSLDGKTYIWNGTSWYEEKTFLTPPEATIRRLNVELQQQLALEMEQDTDDPIDLIRRASRAREAGHYSAAERSVRKALELEPGDQAALAVLCSVLRARGHPQQALDETEGFTNPAHPPLLTSRAAALCDLGRWEDAKHEVGRALAVGQSEEAFSVVHRIKAARPELYRPT
jgi:tetratricopeptide (TPR) repeat protein